MHLLFYICVISSLIPCLFIHSFDAFSEKLPCQLKKRHWMNRVCLVLTGASKLAVSFLQSSPSFMSSSQDKKNLSIGQCRPQMRSTTKENCLAHKQKSLYSILLSLLHWLSSDHELILQEKVRLHKSVGRASCLVHLHTDIDANSPKF